MRALAAILLLLPLALPLLAAQSTGAPLPEGCREERALLVCEWRFKSTERLPPVPDRPHELSPATWSLPFAMTPRTLATVVVSFENGTNQGWRFTMYETGGQDERATWRHLGQSVFAPSSANSVSRALETTTHLLLSDAIVAPVLEFTPRAQEAGFYNTGNPRANAVSTGDFVIRYVGEPLPQGVPPSRPAATQADPHLSDVPFDAPTPDSDILAVWLDDGYLGDGIFDVHMALLDVATFDVNRSSGIGSNELEWTIAFDIGDETYVLDFEVQQRRGLISTVCRLDSRSPGFMSVPCTMDAERSVLSWQIPEQYVGTPAPGVLFENLRAMTTSSTDPIAASDDLAEGPRYAFALGGPPVWDVLNPRLAVPVPEPAPWYVEPLATENLPDTLQVVGALLAVSTAVLGFVAVRRVRARTRALLTRVDELEARHQGDAKAALLALGTLEAEFTDLLRRGKISESQYQVAVIRLTAAATRMARRRDLGLDDGVPDAA